VGWPLAVLREVVGEENKARLGKRAWERRDQRILGGHLFFFGAFFFAGMCSPPFGMSDRFGGAPTFCGSLGQHPNM
jgi:hypothetical protein